MSRLLSINHVNITVPTGAAGEARRFYTEVLGLPEIPRPEPIASSPGFWAQVGAVQLHCSEEETKIKTSRAHVAFELDTLAGVRELVTGAGGQWESEEPHGRRAFCRDPFGNRIELIVPGTQRM